MKKSTSLLLLIGFCSLLAACKSGGGDDKKGGGGTPVNPPSLSVSGDSTVVTGFSGKINVMETPSITGFTNSGSESTNSKLSNIRLAFTNPEVSNDFTVSYSSQCGSLAQSEQCIVTIKPNGQALSLANKKVSYLISATADGGKAVKSQPQEFDVRSLTVNKTTLEGSGNKTTVKISNTTGKDESLDGLKFSSSDKDIKFDKGTCSGVLKNGSACYFKVSATNLAVSKNADYEVYTPSGSEALEANLAVVRPKLVIHAETKSIGPYQKVTYQLINESPVPAEDIRLNVPKINQVVSNTDCGKSLAGLSSCDIQFSASEAPDSQGSQPISISGDNFDAVNDTITASVPSGLNVSLKSGRVVTNSNAEKQLLVRVENNTSGPVSNLLIDANPKLANLKVLNSLSSCAASSVLGVGDSCHYVLDYSAGVVAKPSKESATIIIGGASDGSVPAAIPFSSDNYTSFYSIPNNLLASAKAIAADEVHDVVKSGGKIYVATSGGLSISTDGGLTWVTKTSANGLGSNSVNGVAVAGDRIVAATNEGVSISRDGGKS